MILNRIARGLKRQDWFTAVLELVILVAGIYIGLQVDDWVDERRDREAEAIYLDLLARDVDELQQETASQLLFERDLLTAAARAYRFLSSADPAAHREELATLLPALGARRTLTLSSATFDQMVSSGHLQLIEDRELRDKLVRYFSRMERDERILGKNNQDLVDDIFSPFLFETGITPIAPARRSTESPLIRGNALLLEALGPDFEARPDEVLSRPPDAESWSDIRRQVLFRAAIAGIGQAKAETIAVYLDELAVELEAAAGRR